MRKQKKSRGGDLNMAKEKNVEVLSNGVSVETGKDNWVEDVPVYAEGWNSGQGVHFGCSLGFLAAVAKAVPELVVGKRVSNNAPVIDAVGLTTDILNTYIEAKGLEVLKIKSARTSISKQAKEAIEAISQDAEILALLQSKPELAAKLKNVFG